jgi:hypothetical protein
MLDWLDPGTLVEPELVWLIAGFMQYFGDNMFSLI